MTSDNTPDDAKLRELRAWVRERWHWTHCNGLDLRAPGAWPQFIINEIDRLLAASPPPSQECQESLQENSTPEAEKPLEPPIAIISPDLADAIAHDPTMAAAMRDLTQAAGRALDEQRHRVGGVSDQPSMLLPKRNPPLVFPCIAKPEVEKPARLPVVDDEDGAGGAEQGDEADLPEHLARSREERIEAWERGRVACGFAGQPWLAEALALMREPAADAAEVAALRKETERLRTLAESLADRKGHAEHLLGQAGKQIAAAEARIEALVAERNAVAIGELEELRERQKCYPTGQSLHELAVPTKDIDERLAALRTAPPSPTCKPSLQVEPPPSREGDEVLRGMLKSEPDTYTDVVVRELCRRELARRQP